MTGDVVDEAASVIAVTLLEEAYRHLPPERVAGAVSLANLEPVRRMVTAITLTAWREGEAAGARRGRLELEMEMADDWRPIAERVRGQANSPTHDELERRRAFCTGGNHPGGPVEVW